VKEENNRIVIVAPHADDELIGCFSVISNESRSICIVYTDTNIDIIRREEALSLKSKFNNVTSQYFTASIPPVFINPKTTLYFPDPTEAGHYQHRRWGAIGESMLRSGLDVIFYSINMQAPYCFEVEHWMKKKEVLDEVYPSQKDLWTNDGKYYLFEGRCKWLVK